MAGTWQGLVNQPIFNTSTMILLTDGRVMVQEEAQKYWHALTPDSSGSYVSGTWSTLKPMSFWRRYYASGVLKDGRVIIVGGEQSGDVGDTNKGEIYDPVSDTWDPIPSPPGWSTVGDAASCILPDGRLLIGALNPSTACIIYDPTINSWTPAASKAVTSNEETWVLLPDETIVTTQCWNPYQTEKYIISSNTWKNEGALPVTIVDPVMHEMGPGMLMYNGKVIFFGSANEHGHGKSVIYTPPPFPTGTGTWVAGPDIPAVGRQAMVSNDCPASLMPNGKVLFTAANFKNNDWGSPVQFFEYDPTSNTIMQAPTPANNGMFPYPQYPGIYWSRMMLLPSGQVLFSASSKNVQCYTPDGGPQETWRPTISSVIPHGSGVTDYYLLKGTQLNGLSQANMYGDDCSTATNYPIVRLQNSLTNKVYLCRTFHFSTLGVATGGSLQSARFTTPNIPYGEYDLCVIANGISSHCVSFCHCRPGKPCCYVRKCVDPCCCHEDPCRTDDRASDPEVVELRDQVKRLQNSMDRVIAVASGEAGRAQPKDTKEQEESKDK
jgi:Kelch motif